MLRMHKVDEWYKFLSSININEGSTFKLYRRLLNKPKPDYPQTGTHGPIYSAIDNAKSFADAFKEQFATNHGEALPEVDLSVVHVRNSTIVHYAYTTPDTDNKTITQP